MYWRLVPPAVAWVTTFTVYAAGQGPAAPSAAPAAEPAATPSATPPTPTETGSASEVSGPPEAMPPEGSDSTEGVAPEAEPAANAAPELGPPPAEAAAVPTEEEYEEPEPPMTPPAPDSLGGHFVLGVGGALVYPTGHLGSDLKQRRQIKGGFGLGLDAGIGVGRQAVLGLWGQFGGYSSGSRCTDCKSQSLAAGPFVRYHLVQGLRFDPWLSFGIGFRKLSIDDAGASTSYSGLEWARIQVGGDWYLSKNFGFGPLLGLSSGGYFDRPDIAGDFAAFWELSVGLRLVLDIPGKQK